MYACKSQMADRQAIYLVSISHSKIIQITSKALDYMLI